jgi:hypothetical protein
MLMGLNSSNACPGVPRHCILLTEFGERDSQFPHSIPIDSTGRVGALSTSTISAAAQAIRSVAKTFDMYIATSTPHSARAFAPCSLLSERMSAHVANEPSFSPSRIWRCCGIEIRNARVSAVLKVCA